MLHVCTWKWDNGTLPKKGIKYGSEYVNVLNSMLKRHLHIDYQFCCITDDPVGVDEDVRIIPLWTDHLSEGGCWVRLKMFDAEMKDIIGDRFASIDLDVVITDDVTPIFDRKEDFLIWGEHWRQNPYCGSLWMMNAGCRAEVWDEFVFADYPKEAAKKGKNGPDKWKYGTDQVRINDCLYPDETMWTTSEGIFNFRTDIRRDAVQTKRQKFGRHKARRIRAQGIENEVEKAAEQARKNSERKGRSARSTEVVVRKAMSRARGKAVIRASKEAAKERKQHKAMDQRYVKGWKGTTGGTLPDNARMIFFNGSSDPANSTLQEQYPWIGEHWK